MTDRKRIILLLIIAVMMAFAGNPVFARGNKEAGLPEPVEVKGDFGNESEKDVSNKDSGYPPEGWVTDIHEAYRIANAENKKILIDFTGSDWCGWCKKLEKEIFSKPEFKSWADDNLVKLFIDAPQGIKLSNEQIKHNQTISQLLGIQGYPSIWLLDSDLSPLLVTGYRKGGPEEYIKHLSEDRVDVKDEEREKFRISFTQAIEENLGPLK